MFCHLSISAVLVAFTAALTLHAAAKPHAVPAFEANRTRARGLRTMDQQPAHLSKGLKLPPDQQKLIGPLFRQHHDRIQALLDKNRTLSREPLASQIHATSDDTHSEIEAPLTEHQKQPAKAMQKRVHNGERNKPHVLSTKPRMAAVPGTNLTWTNEDLERLGEVPGLISAVGQAANGNMQGTKAPVPQSRTKDPAWYAAQAALLHARLDAEQADLYGFTQALEDTRDLKATTRGIDLAEDHIGITPEATMDILQSRVHETQSALDALEDLARRNGIPPGVLRGSWHGRAAENAVTATEQSQSDTSTHGGAL